MTQPSIPKAPPRRRRKEARPAEIVAAAMAVFADVGFAAARMDEIARRAGVAKGTVFVYFPTKNDLFRAVAQSVLAVNFEPLRLMADQPLDRIVPLLLARAAYVGDTPVAAVVRLLIAEARTFPDLAQVWHDEVVSQMLGFLTAAIEAAQARGEARAGDARLYAFSVIGPMMAGFMFRQVFAETDVQLPDLQALATQHAAVVLDGLMNDPMPGI